MSSTVRHLLIAFVKFRQVAIGDAVVSMLILDRGVCAKGDAAVPAVRRALSKAWL